MACYCCDDCHDAKHNGGKCNKFQYECPFDILEAFDEVDIKIIRKIIDNINIQIDNLKAIDKNHGVMEEDIEALRSALSNLEERISIDLQKEWNEINED
jgi:hypothetical protein